jgi:hypothetical protein
MERRFDFDFSSVWIHNDSLARSKTLEDYDRRKLTDPTTPYPTPPVFKFDF